MAAHPPPVPPDQRPDKGPDKTAPGVGGSARKPQGDNPREQGQSGNISQNTTNKGLQHDR